MVYKMCKEIIVFDDSEVEKHNFTNMKALFQYMIQTLIKQQYLVSFTSVKKVLNILSFTKIKKSQTIVHNSSKKIVYRKDFDYMSFFKKNKELLEKYNEIWNKVRNRIKKEFDSQPVYKEKLYTKKNI